MQMVSRTRSGKGIGEQNLGQLQLADRASGSELQGEGEAQSSAVERVEESNQLQGPGAEAQGAGEALPSSGGGVVAHPFWSSRMQEEARLRAARPEYLANPDFLGSVNIQQSGTSSTSTELRVAEGPTAGDQRGPAGPPVVYGP